MAENTGIMSVFVDFTPTHAKDERLRPRFENDLKDKLAQGIPAMVSRLAELDPIMTAEVGEYVDFMMEASEAFMYGHWRSVVALVGVAVEGFTDGLYSRLGRIVSKTGKEVSRKELFGDDERLPENRKLAILHFFGVITPTTYDALTKIKRLRDQYVHPPRKARDVGADAREAMRLFRAILKERFDRDYTVKAGKVVRRQDKPSPG